MTHIIYESVIKLNMMITDRPDLKYIIIVRD